MRLLLDPEATALSFLEFRPGVNLSRFLALLVSSTLFSHGPDAVLRW